MPSETPLEHSELQFGAQTFFAKQHKGDTCGSNGLPLTPNSIIICGKAQFLKTFKHPNLCQYLDIIRGKHERTIVVSQNCGKPISNYIQKQYFQLDDVKRIAYQILLGLKELHTKKIIHRNLSSENILLQEDKNIKLFNYGLYYMTGCGKLVSFPILQILYTAPEIFLQGKNSYLNDAKVDIWSLGIILIELVLDKFLWNSLQLGQQIRKIVSLIQCNGSIFERIAREHNCYETYKNLPTDIKDIIESCLKIYPKDRLSSSELLDKDIFKNFNDILLINSNNNKLCESFELSDLYYWWQLAGGDVYQELKKQGLIRSSPPILSLPNVVTINGCILGQERNPATLYDSKIVQMPLKALYQRFAHLSFNSYYPLIHCTLKIITEAEPLPYEANSLPLIIREKDPEYQFHRIILFRRLLYGYPYNRDLIIKEAIKDIPPLLRGEVWAALLNVIGNYEREYTRIDKESPTVTDRQIEVDIPRCHQYNELLSSAEGHKKLKRILKAWVHKNPHYVYWQGLDSLTAPFLYLNFNDEAKAFACLSNFIPKYLHKLFLKDNSAVIQEYLAKFSQLIVFHDPELANHLMEINFVPELFAIPWFLTVFSHVFPLYKIFHLWDKLLLSDSSFPLHIGLSVLTQMRNKLLNSGFNECILLFSNLPEVDIEKCILYSTATYKSTPKSITTREHQNSEFHSKGELDITGVTLQDLIKEKCPRISAADVINLIRNNQNYILLIDIRNPVQFNRCSIIGSINIPFSSVTFGDINLNNVGIHCSTIQNSEGKVIVIVGNEETDLELFPRFLLKCGIKKVCVLHGGFNILIPIIPSILTSSNYF